MRTLVVPAAIMFLAVAPVFAQPTREHLDAMRHLRLGQDSLRLEQFDMAESEFQAAIRLEPSLEMAHYGLGQVYMATRRYPAAVHAYLACRDAFVVSNRQRALGDLEAQRALDDQFRAIEAQETAVAVGGGSGQKFELDRTIADLRALQRNSTSTSGIPAWISVALGSATSEAMRFRTLSASTSPRSRPTRSWVRPITTWPSSICRPAATTRQRKKYPRPRRTGSA